MSPVLFAIYIAEIHQAIESRVEDCRGISFVDGVTWIVEGYDANDVVGKLEQCAAASLEWAEHNAVRFETTKSEAMERAQNWTRPCSTIWTDRSRLDSGRVGAA